MKKKTALSKTSSPPAKPGAKGLLTDVRELILTTRQTVSQGVNSALVLLYWKIGQCIRTDILKEKRAGYGEKIVHALSAKLADEFGRGFTRTNLFNMTRFAEEFPDPKIVHALSGQLSWTHFRRIIYLDDPLKREFYAEMCRIEKWNTRTLNQKIQSMLFERTALSKKPDKLIATELKKLREEDKLTPDLVFRDPYMLDFLGLKDTASSMVLLMDSRSKDAAIRCAASVSESPHGLSMAAARVASSAREGLIMDAPDPCLPAFSRSIAAWAFARSRVLWKCLSRFPVFVSDLGTFTIHPDGV